MDNKEISTTGLGPQKADSALKENRMTAIATKTFEDLLYNIISDTVMVVYRKEKVACMKTAETMAFKASEEQLDNDKKNTDERAPPTKTDPESGKLLLIGNPLKTIKENLWPRCSLPFRDPLLSDESPEKQYCAKSTYSSLPGYDIYGRSLTKAPSKKPPKASKASPTNTRHLKATSLPPVPTSRCPNCSQRLTVSQMARQLNKCIRSSDQQGNRSARTRDTDKPKVPTATITKMGRVKKKGPTGTKKAAPKKTAAVEKKPIESATSAGKGIKGGAPKGKKREGIEKHQDDEEYEEAGPRAKTSRKLV